MARRFLRSVASEKWWREELQHWLDRNQVPADCLSDLKTTNNTLSIFAADDDDKAERIMAALALQRAIGGAGQNKSVSDQAFMTFDDDLVRSLGISMEQKPGQTKDLLVNSWHFDLIELSGEQLAAFAQALLRNSEPQTLYHTQLLSRIRRNVDEGVLDGKVLPPRVVAQLSAS